MIGKRKAQCDPGSPPAPERKDRGELVDLASTEVGSSAAGPVGRISTQTKRTAFQARYADNQVRLSFEQKVELLDRLRDKKVSKKKLALEFGLGESTPRKIKKD